MKFRVTLKDPDGFYDAVRDAAKNEIAMIGGISPDERESLLETRVENVRKAMERWVEYGEYVSLEFDTDAFTATVLARK